MMSMDEAVSIARGQRQDYEAVRLQLSSEYPTAMKALKIIDLHRHEPKGGKGFNLVAREHKKLGFVYYVRYYSEGKMLPSKWNTHTSSREEAAKFALENKERIVSNYLLARSGKAYELYRNFFEKNSPYLEGRRSRQISGTTRAGYHSIITKKFIPFLKEKGITGYGGVNKKVLEDFQDRLLAGEKAQSVNNDLKAVRRVFAYLESKNMIERNPCPEVKNLAVYENDRRARGCHDAEDVRGVFKRAWADREAYLLCLLIYATGMRNCEIKRIKAKDIITQGGIRYIDIKESKTPNGVRRVPLHEFAWKRLAAYAGGKKENGPIFGGADSMDFMRANIELGKKLGIGTDKLRQQNITFYSGRHYWKTLMRGEGLGEAAEELFMGHKVSGDMRKLYDHKDKQGRKLLAKKARQVFGILDKGLFGTVKKKS